jgi:hypothetical protein
MGRQIALLAIMLSAASNYRVLAQGRRTPVSSAEDKVRAFLMEYVTSKNTTPRETRYADAFIDLNGDGVEEVVVYLDGRDWCGTGGCLTLVLTRTGESYRSICRVLATRPPIRALKKSSHGWRTLTAWVAGGGILTGYEAELAFDGRRYPISAAPPSSPRLKGNLPGTAIISGDLQNEKVLITGGR